MQGFIISLFEKWLNVVYLHFPLKRYDERNLPIRAKQLSKVYQSRCRVKFIGLVDHVSYTVGFVYIK